MRRVTMVAVAVLFAATPTFASEKTFQPPTATELWQLRSACAQLGQKIAERPHGLNWKVFKKSSRYDPTTDHCYVLITYNGVVGDIKGQVRNYLYDGQTNKMLAATIMNNGKKVTGTVFGPQHVSPPPKSNSVETRMNADYDDADNYINRLMSEDREGRQ